jgi:hypothetical protein
MFACKPILIYISLFSGQTGQTTTLAVLLRVVQSGERNRLLLGSEGSWFTCFE